MEGLRPGVDVVVAGATSGDRRQTRRVDQTLTEHGRQELGVVDVLDLSADDAPRLLEERLVIPQRIGGEQPAGQPVVLAQPQRVQRRQRRTRVGSVVARIQTTAIANETLTIY